MIETIQNEARNAAWSSGVFTLFFIIPAIIVLTILSCIFFPFANMLIMFFIFAAELVGLFIPVFIYFRRAEQYMINRCLELDNTHPGLYEAYELWKEEKNKNALDGI